MQPDMWTRDMRWDGDPETINANIRAYMGRHKLNQDGLADTLGISRQAVSRRLNGETAWRHWDIQRLAAAWGVTVEALTDGDDEDVPA